VTTVLSETTASDRVSRWKLIASMKIWCHGTTYCQACVWDSSWVVIHSHGKPTESVHARIHHVSPINPSLCLKLGMLPTNGPLPLPLTVNQPSKSTRAKSQSESNIKTNSGLATWCDTNHAAELSTRERRDVFGFQVPGWNWRGKCI